MAESNWRTGLTLDRQSIRRGLAYLVLAVVLGTGVWGVLAPDSFAATLFDIVTDRSTIKSGLRLAVPIALAGLGGIYAEKSGVINIGLEGLLIISAFTGVLVTHLLGPDGSTFLLPNIWWGVVFGTLASVALALLFAVVCIEFRADQIIAGLAVWLLALGLAPFASGVVFGRPNTESVGTIAEFTVPGLEAFPFVGFLFTETSPFVYAMFLAVPLTWYVFNRTAFGRWVRASGENPRALDTVGVNVSRVRYVAVVLSGVLSGIGGSALSLGAGQFVGNGQTMVNGRGFIAIVAYLFGNYNPVGAFGASFLFAGLEAVQIRLQQVQGYAIPDSLIQTIPYVTVIVILALVGRTRIPSAAGEHYESGED
jgi:simple sugar transport system permease protein